MRKPLALWSIMALCLLMTTGISRPASATERSWLSLGKDIDVSGYTGSVTGFVRANDSDLLTINWKSGNIGSYFVDVYIFTDTPPLNYTDGMTEITHGDSGWPSTSGDYNGYGWGYSIGFKGDSSPSSAWVRMSCPDIVYIIIYPSSSLANSITLNVTKTSEALNPWDNITAIESQINSMNSTLVSFNFSLADLAKAFQENFTLVNNYTACLNASIGELNASMLMQIEELNALINDINANFSMQFQKITELWENITSLSNGLSDQRAQELTDINSLKAQLVALHASFSVADASLLSLMEIYDTSLKNLLDANNGSISDSISVLREQLDALRGEIQNISFPQPEQYNDTLLWREITRLNATPSMSIVQVNNTTVVNKTEVNPTTFVNRTGTRSLEVDGAVSGALAGLLTGLAVSVCGLVFLERRLKKRYGGMVTPPGGGK